jgi:hypothetical protein
MAVSQIKPPGQRVRRNKDAPQWKTLDAAAPATPPPAPEHWSAETVEWWRLIWESPMAKIWIQSDVPNLRALGELMELPKKSAEHYAEIRQMRAHYGLTPASRKSLMWNIPLEDAPAAEAEEPKQSNVRRMRAV